MNKNLTHEQMINAMTCGVIVTDETGYIIFSNKCASQILKFSTERMSGAYIAEILPITGPLVIETLKSGNQLVNHHIQGKNVSLMLNLIAIKNGHQVRGALCTFIEMREFAIAVKKNNPLSFLNKELDAVFKSSSDGLCVCDWKGEVLNINKASERLNGIRAEDIKGKNIQHIIGSDLVNKSVTTEVLETLRQVSMLQYVKKTKKQLLLTGTPVFDHKGELTLIVINERDITELNVLRAQLEKSRMVTQKYKDELSELNLLELKEQNIVSESAQMREVWRVALKLARLNVSNILVLGDTGTGKGLLAKFIHKNRGIAKAPFISINCAALPENLLEAELFGYEKGAFTGASGQGKAGLFELAQGGSLFLDEIGDLPLSMQVKLLKYLDDQEVMRLGSTHAKKIDCTILAATNCDLERMVKKKLFRQDLFYRLDTFTIRIPPLRERPEDIFELVKYFLAKYNQDYGLSRRISQAGLEALLAYQFPGNVRELKNILKRAVVMNEADLLDETMIYNPSSYIKRCAPSIPKEKSGKLFSDKILSLERTLLQEAIARCRSTREMAAFLAISQPTVVRKMKKHGLSISSIHKRSTSFPSLKNG